MKRLFLCFAILMSVNVFALNFESSATEIKKATTQAIYSGDYKEITDLLETLENASEKQQTVILNAIKTALNSQVLKKYTEDAAKRFNEVPGVTVTKTAGGKYNIQFTTYNVKIKADIPRGAVEKPTLSTDPAANKR